MKKLCTLAIVAACLVAAAPASAEVTISGTGEPAYTNSTQNTHWFQYTIPQGMDGYRLHFRYYRDSVLVKEERHTVFSSGTVWANWSGVATLEDGSSYAICVRGEYRIPNDSLWFPEGPDSCALGTMQGKRSSTTIDRAKPTTSLVAAGGASTTRNGSIPVSIGFQDGAAGPYPATFICVEAGTGPCQGQHVHSPACSQPDSPGRNTTFTCNVDASALPDGPVTVCATGTDASVPDNPNGPDQSGQAYQGNRSDSTCDTVVLDRSGPALTTAASSTTIQAGHSVAFSAQVSDAVSGVDGSTSRWEFSDGAPAIAGTVASRSFEHPGTYVVTFRAKDAAGNESAAQTTITVTPLPGDGGEQAPPPPPTPPGNPGVRFGSVTVLVPKRVKLGRVRAIALSAHADQPGTLALRLTRGKKTYSKLTVGLAQGETKQRLRLPKKLKPGIYTLQIGFKASGTSRTATGKARVALRK